MGNRIAIVHKHTLGDNFKMPEYLSEDGQKIVFQKVLTGSSWAYQNHKSYAEHNGYMFINDTEPWVDTKPPDWSIWQAALRALKDPSLDVDWIFFSVNDIIYTDMESKLEKFIEGCLPDKFMATGQYNSYIKWGVENIRGDKWRFVKYTEPRNTPMISGWSHFLKKDNRTIEFVEMLDNDTRLKDVTELNSNSFTGDIYLSLIFNGYHEYRNNWHLFKTEDHIRIPKGNVNIDKWNKTWNLKYQEDAPAPMVFVTCCLELNETIGYQKQYTNNALRRIV